MRLTLAFAFAAAVLAFQPGLTTAARADAIPMPEELTDEQKLLIGVWQEEKPNLPIGLGHSFMLRTFAIGNTDATMLEFGGVAPSNMYGSSATRGTWTVQRQDDKTLILTLDQGEGRGTVYTLVFDGKDAFTLSDAEMSRFAASRFTRVPASKSQPD